MSSFSMDTLIVLEGLVSSTNFVLEFNYFLNSHDIVMDVGALYFLNDYEEEEFDPEDIVNVEETLNKLANWPVAGWLEYAMPGCSILISYKTIDNFQIGGICLSASEAEYNYQKAELDNFIYDLYGRYKPLRIIQDVDIFEDLNIEDEIKRVRNGVFEGNYEVDLRY